jgi:hypothetical protein
MLFGYLFLVSDLISLSSTLAVVITKLIMIILVVSKLV